MGYSISATTNTGLLTYDYGSVFALNWLALLPVGTYTMTIYGNATGYGYATDSFSVQVLPENTSFSFVVPPAYSASQYVMLIAQGEIANVSIYYNDTYNDDLGPVVSANLGSQAVSIFPVGNTTYWCTIYASQYTIGTYTLGIFAQKNNYESYSTSLSCQILDYWNTTESVVQPPTTVPWGNNASFIVSYSGNEAPRTSLITGAYITQLNITIQVATVHYNQVFTLGKFLWNPLGME